MATAPPAATFMRSSPCSISVKMPMNVSASTIADTSMASLNTSGSSTNDTCPCTASANAEMGNNINASTQKILLFIILTS